MKITFVVTIKFPTFLEPTVVRNYVNMALKKYQKLCVETNKADYFGFIGGPDAVGFHITEVPYASPENLRAVITQVVTLSQHFENVDR